MGFTVLAWPIRLCLSLSSSPVSSGTTLLLLHKALDRIILYPAWLKLIPHFRHFCMLSPLPGFLSFILLTFLAWLTSYPSFLCSNVTSSRRSLMTPTSDLLDQGSRNRAAQQEASGRQASKASSASPHHLHYHLNDPSHPIRGKNCLPGNRSLVLKKLGTAVLDYLMAICYYMFLPAIISQTSLLNFLCLSFLISKTETA